MSSPTSSVTSPGGPGAGSSNPRKFSEKIALHRQKEAEERAEYEKIMQELRPLKGMSTGSGAATTAPVQHQVPIVSPQQASPTQQHRVRIQRTLFDMISDCFGEECQLFED